MYIIFIYHSHKHIDIIFVKTLTLYFGAKSIYLNEGFFTILLYYNTSIKIYVYDIDFKFYFIELTF